MATPYDEWQRENLKGAIYLGAQTLKSLELINGGATIGILTFYGNVLARGELNLIDRATITYALWCFGAGVACAAIASGLGYISQLILAHFPEKIVDVVIRCMAIAFGFASITLFCLGVFFAGISFGG
jgi:hypothetical protein